MGKQNKITIKELWDRFHSPTPQFWKAIRTKMLALSAALAALGGGLELIEGLWPWVYTVAEYMIKIGAVAPLLIAFVASFTVESREDGSI